jgi:hypothetical protein
MLRSQSNGDPFSMIATLAIVRCTLLTMGLLIS